MAVFLSLITAAMFGTGDFLGGLATKRAQVLQVVAGSHIVGLVGATIAALLLADEFTLRSMLLGAAGGAFGGLGVALLYRRLSMGQMAVVAPLTAVTSAAVPAAWGAATGDSLGLLAWIGVALALVAIALVSWVKDPTSAPVTAAVIVESLIAGAGFGTMFIFFDAADASTAPWPIVGARLATTIVLFAALALTRKQLLPRGKSLLGLIALVGVFDTASNATFLYAVDEGALTFVAVISSLYPVSTVLLARFVLDERMTKLQVWGMLAAFVATGLIAGG